MVGRIAIQKLAGFNLGMVLKGGLENSRDKSSNYFQRNLASLNWLKLVKIGGYYLCKRFRRVGIILLREV